MPSIYATSRVGNVFTLNTGEVIDIDTFPGNGWTVNRCANITTNLQENYLDEVVDRDALPVGDPDKTMTAVELQATYGGWFVELNTQGSSNDIRLRHTTVEIFPIDGGANFNVRTSEVRR